MRFDDEMIEELVKIARWDWSAEKITENLEAIVGADLKLLKKIDKT
jgi:virginiamycin A acetyltransferase